ncbi:hypothetical protein SHL15_8987 [Streptomyces hygroscopicus subsp. limoneus]|nr:hypothetical protein SHL15_8987 [Streptomyces hygroscopicus subsp. limoneus]
MRRPWTRAMYAAASMMSAPKQVGPVQATLSTMSAGLALPLQPGG